MEKRAANKGSVEDAAITALRHVQEIGLEVFRSLMCNLCWLKARPNPKGWSFISRLLSSKRVSCVGDMDANEVEELDLELLVLRSTKDINVRMPAILKQLEAVESNIQELEEDLECLFRHLVKTRVSLLNILNP